MTHIHIIGGGLSGSEAAYQLAQRGFNITLYEMRIGANRTFAHQTDTLAELVCSNSFRSADDENNAVGQLHWELRQMDSLIMRCADAAAVPAGGALAMDREIFANAVQQAIPDHPNITLKREKISDLAQFGVDTVLVASGPLTDPDLSQSLQTITGSDYLAFFDAIAPIVYFDSIDLSKAWFQSRYDKGDGKDYINCAMDEGQYKAFIEAMLAAPKTQFKDWEQDTPYFEGCLPVEVCAERGFETLRFGCMKPVGLKNPHTGEQPYAVVQLRQDNKLGTLYNIVGFQTKMTYGAQKEVLKMIPGLEGAEFARLGGIHRNTFINSPQLLTDNMQLKAKPNIYMAGQITGVEGYVESTAMGMLAAHFMAGGAKPPLKTSIGALYGHITGGGNVETFQPMNINFGLYPMPETRIKKKERKAFYTGRAKAALTDWLGKMQTAAA